MLLSGCYRTSTIPGKAKKLLLEMQEVMGELMPVFCRLPSIISPDDITVTEFRVLEKIFVCLYSKTCNTFEVNETRRILLSRENRSVENIPPTKATLKKKTYTKKYFTVVEVVTSTT